jgi:CspA family cold shock protein
MARLAGFFAALRNDERGFPQPQPIIPLVPQGRGKHPGGELQPSSRRVAAIKVSTKLGFRLDRRFLGKSAPPCLLAALWYTGLSVKGHQFGQSPRENAEMAEGTIKTLTTKGFGFIKTGDEEDLFFHSSSLDGVRFDELHEGQKVSYTEGRGPKGPRAENVKPV